MTVHVIDTSSDKYDDDRELTTLPSGEDGLVTDIGVNVDQESVGTLLLSFGDGPENTRNTNAPSAARYVITAAASTKQEKTVYLGEATFVTGWEAARDAAFTRFLDDIDVDTSGNTDEEDTEAPDLGQLEAEHPLDRPKNFELEYSNDAGSWVVAVTALPK